MNQELIFDGTNYLNEYLFYNKFQFWVQRLDAYHSQESKPKITLPELTMAYNIDYECGLRASELIALERRDFNLDLRILTIRHAKTGQNQKTTILPYRIKPLEQFFANYSKTEKLFRISRMTLWRYAKQAGMMAGIGIFEVQNQRTIEGLWTHAFRKACSKRMRDYGADRELRMLKLRHAFKDAHDAYDNYDLNALLRWEDKTFNIDNFFNRNVKQVREN